METSSKQKSWTRGWTILIVGATITEFRALQCGRRENTLSNAVRCTLRVNTPAGRAAFLCWWAWFSWWWILHILKGSTDAE